jgi:hypothetical protein
MAGFCNPGEDIRFLQQHATLIQLQAECPQCNCGEIRQMLTFFTNIYCPKAYHRPDHSISIVEFIETNYYCYP